LAPIIDRELRLKRLRFRSSHRATRESDLLLGGFFDARSAGWSDAEIAWFETLLEEPDPDITAWTMGTAAPPKHLESPMFDALIGGKNAARPR